MARNDGLVSVISSQHPFNQAYTQATDTNQKDLASTPTKHDWDHVDFVGQDSLTQNVLELNYNNFGMLSR